MGRARGEGEGVREVLTLPACTCGGRASSRVGTGQCHPRHCGCVCLRVSAVLGSETRRGRAARDESEDGGPAKAEATDREALVEVVCPAPHRALRAFRPRSRQPAARRRRCDWRQTHEDSLVALGEPRGQGPLALALLAPVVRVLLVVRVLGFLRGGGPSRVRRGSEGEGAGEVGEERAPCLRVGLRHTCGRLCGR